VARRLAGRWAAPPQLRLYLGLYALALLLRLALAWPVTGPSYFDASYYLAAAESLVTGHGLTDQVIWNYLDDPAGLPRPSHLYWLPLNSWLAALGLLLNGWRGVQAVFIVLSALLVPLAAYLTWSLEPKAPCGWGRRDYAVAAGLLALFSGHYTGYWGSAPDSFGPFALAIAGAILAAASERWALVGVATGLAALTRADGLLIGLVLGGYALRRRCWRGVVLLPAACLLALLPWWARNWLVAGTPLPGSGLKTIWLRDYEELFYLGQELNLHRYLAWGLGPLLASKLQAGLYNVYVVAGGPWPWLAPFAILGAWAQRRDRRIALALGYGLALWLVMTLGFTFPAQHGSTFHSASALVIFQAACVPAGIAAGVGRLRHWLKWDVARYTRYFLIRLTALAVVVSLIQYGLIWLRIIRPELTTAGWINHGQDAYQIVNRWLTAQGIPSGEPVLVRDPPSFYHTTSRRAVVLPSDLSFLAPTAARYAAGCAVLEGAGIARFDAALAAGRLVGWRGVLRTVVADQPLALFCYERKEQP
jgi:hypothetical protein